jgi:hypothetical protein
MTSRRYGSASKPLVLDQLLADVFVTEVKRTCPRFATLFLNAGAHIQHHYLFSARSYQGEQRNPDWYIAPGVDPVFEVYSLYDRILGCVKKAFPDARIMIATGLHQDPHGEVTFYWRLRNHAVFLNRIGVPYARVEQRMSRDFLVVCESAGEARKAQTRLEAAVASDGIPLFEVDNRGSDLFVMLTYPRDIRADLVFTVDGQRFEGLKDDVVFVALKNGEHNGLGYFLDSDARFESTSAAIRLKDIPNRVMNALGLEPLMTVNAPGRTDGFVAT